MRRINEWKIESMKEWQKWNEVLKNEMKCWMNEWRKEWTKWNEMRMEWNENDMKMKWYELTWTWDKCMNQWNLPTLSYKKSRRPQCLTIFMWNRALPTVLCTCCRPHLPKVLQASEFFTIFMWNRALCRPHLPKDVRTPQSFTIVIWNRALASVLCTFCRQLLPIEARTSRNRDPTSAITEATLPEKTQAFVPESLFNPEFMRSRPLTLPNYLMKMKMKMEIKMKMMMMMVMMTMVILMILMILMMWLTWRCGWHDDVVDMMMWLPWWWESWPWQSSVTPKFSN